MWSIFGTFAQDISVLSHHQTKNNFIRKRKAFFSVLYLTVAMYLVRLAILGILICYQKGHVAYLRYDPVLNLFYTSGIKDGPFYLTLSPVIYFFIKTHYQLYWHSNRTLFSLLAELVVRNREKPLIMKTLKCNLKLRNIFKSPLDTALKMKQTVETIWKGECIGNCRSICTGFKNLDKRERSRLVLIWQVLESVSFGAVFSRKLLSLAKNDQNR